MPGNISWRDARSELGFESGFELRTEADYTLALSVWRERTGAAQRGCNERALVTTAPVQNNYSLRSSPYSHGFETPSQFHQSLLPTILLAALPFNIPPVYVTEQIKDEIRDQANCDEQEQTDNQYQIHDTPPFQPRWPSGKRKGRMTWPATSPGGTRAANTVLSLGFDLSAAAARQATLADVSTFREANRPAVGEGRSPRAIPANCPSPAPGRKPARALPVSGRATSRSRARPAAFRRL